MTPAVDGVLATHPIVSAIPFFVPTFIVVAVIVVIVWRDRRRGDDDDAPPDTQGGKDMAPSAGRPEDEPRSGPG